MRKEILILGLVSLCSCSSIDLGKDIEIGMIKGVQENGVCIHKANKLSEYLYEKEIEHEFKVGYRQEDDLRTHAWVEVNRNGNRYVLDPMFRRIYKNPKEMYNAF